MRILYRNRLAIKPDISKLDKVEVCVVYDQQSHCFYVCPPDLRSEDRDVLAERWLMFLRFAESIPTLEFEELFFSTYVERDALEHALATHVRSLSGIPSELVLRIKSARWSLSDQERLNQR
jgi:hypothetical protein